jgi:hypothetical protein
METSNKISSRTIYSGIGKENLERRCNL